MPGVDENILRHLAVRPEPSQRPIRAGQAMRRSIVLRHGLSDLNLRREM